MADWVFAIVPPAGVFAVSGCGADLLINICLTILGYVECFSYSVVEVSEEDHEGHFPRQGT
jgi:uncharacterized membrane protein YqaE (UPF0057 family)